MAVQLDGVLHLYRGPINHRLDAGRPVAFDLKDYAQINHGYAVTKPPQRQRGMFDSFKPINPARQPPTPAREVGQVDQHHAIERHARAAADVMRMNDRGLPVLAHQRRALEEAREAMGKVGPNAAKDPERAYMREPGLATEAAS